MKRELSAIIVTAALLIGATVAECLVDLDSALTGADDVKIYVYEAV